MNQCKRNQLNRTTILCLVLSPLIFFVNAPAILHDISDKVIILKKHLTALSGFSYSYFIDIAIAIGKTAKTAKKSNHDISF
jgi:hypothetical protein